MNMRKRVIILSIIAILSLCMLNVAAASAVRQLHYSLWVYNKCNSPAANHVTFTAHPQVKILESTKVWGI